MNPGSAAQKHSAKCELVSDSLRLFGTLQLKVIGWSMLPTLWPGDTIVVSTTDFSQIVPGEIAMFRREDSFVAHRVLYKNDLQNEMLTRGDAVAQADLPFTSRELLGKVHFIVRNGDRIEPARTINLPRWAFAKIAQRSTCIARLAVIARHIYQSRGFDGVQSRCQP